MPMPGLLLRFIPGLRSINELRAPDLLGEITAGLSVAAVAVPIALAYAEIVGVPSEIGLYATIVGGLAYALFGPSSRYLVLGPDTATCLVLAAAVGAVGATHPEQRAAVASGLTVAAGLAYICASLLRLGFVASLISKPVLKGYLAGVSVTLAVSQLPSLSGVAIAPEGIIRPLIELARRQAEIHWPTAALGIGTLITLRLLKHFVPRFPGAAIVLVTAVVASVAIDLPAQGFAVIGNIPAGLPIPATPVIGGDPAQFILATLGIFIISFSSGIVTARAFGSQLGAQSDANRELAGFGIANLASGLFQGFAVTGADSRTAVALSSGGKSALTGVVAAISVILAATIFAAPLSLLPKAVLGAILLSAAFDLLDLKAFRQLYRIGTSELVFALIAAAGVIWIGVFAGIFFAVLLTLLHLLQVAARPASFLEGRDPDSGSLVTLRRRPDAIQPDQIAIFLFEGSIFFLNADWFRASLEKALSNRPDARWLVLDTSAMMHADSDTVDAIFNLKEALDQRGIELFFGGGHGRFRDILLRSGLGEQIGMDRIFVTPEQALAAAEAMRSRSPIVQR